MAEFVELLGNTLQTSSGQVSTAEALSGKKAVALYFSAHWCPPCRGFTPKLAEWYNTSLKEKGLEVIFVSSDKEESEFKSYFGEQPWLALPYEQREKKSELSKKFKVNGIPSLIILDEHAKTITKDGRSAVSQDPTGEEFPWRPKSLNEILKDATVSKDGKELAFQDAINGKSAVAFYFSAHWCPPCRGFTPKLAEWYTKSLKEKGLEIIFVSSDHDESSFKEYSAEQPWPALDFNNQKLKDKLDSHFDVEGIPTLVILDKDLNLINKDGRSAVSSDPEGKEFPWYPKPVADLEDGPGSINEVPTVLAFCEKSAEDEQKAVEAAMESPAKAFMEKAKAAGEEAEVCFMISKKSGGLGDRVRSLLSLPEGAKDEKKRLVLLDIPSDGAYYLAAEDTAISEENIGKFIADFKEGKLERKQLANC